MAIVSSLPCGLILPCNSCFSHTQRERKFHLGENPGGEIKCALCEWTVTFYFPTQLLHLATNALGSSCNSYLCSLFVALGFPISVPCFLLSLFWFFWLILQNRDRITQDTQKQQGKSFPSKSPFLMRGEGSFSRVVLAPCWVPGEISNAFKPHISSPRVPGMWSIISWTDRSMNLRCLWPYQAQESKKQMPFAICIFPQFFCTKCACHSQ